MPPEPRPTDDDEAFEFTTPTQEEPFEGDEIQRHVHRLQTAGWRPKQGPIFKATAWLILIALALLIGGAIAAMLLGRG